MKRLLTVAFIIFSIILFFFLPVPSFGYETYSTHPALSDEMVDFYNASFSEQLTLEQKEQVVQGSIDEDSAPRWLNHFYDPIFNEGWQAQNLGVIPQNILKIFTKIFLNTTTDVVSSKNWVHNEKLQTKYVSYGGNNTWENGLRSYAEGDTETAFYILGHILHLLEDATVPDHTRNDTHVHQGSGVTEDGGSPYEDYAERFTRASLNMTSELIKNKRQPVLLKSIDNYFDDLAGYSNKYFFSEHTINYQKYGYPKILREDLLYGYGKDKNGVEFPLARITNTFNQKTLSFDKQISLKEASRDPQVLSAYFTRLSEAAVLDGAGVIKLFKEQGEMVKKNPALLGPEPQPAALLPWEKTQSLLFGFLEPAANTISQATSKALASLQNSLTSLFGDAVAPVQTQTPGEIIARPVAAEVPVQNNSLLESKPSTPKKQEPKKAVPPQAVLGQKIETQIPAIPVVQPVVPLNKTAPSKPNVLLTTNGGLSASVIEPEVGLDTSTTLEVDENVSDPIASSTSDIVIVSTTPQVATTSTAVEVIISTSTASTSTPEFVDTTPPSIPSVKLSFVVDGDGPFLKILASAADDSGIVLYDISWSVSTTTEKVWQDFVTSTTSTISQLPVQRGQIYFVRARARDGVGNESLWSNAVSFRIPYTQEVVINEVAWAGTSASSKNDQWIEFYNTTDSPIDLSNWKLFISGLRVDMDLKNKMIAPHGYFLLERSNDTVVRQISADAIYFHAFGFKSAGDVVDLIKDTGEIVDRVDCSQGWFAGDSVVYRSMERINLGLSGSDPANWQNNQGQRGVGRTANGGDVLGSPRQSNFGFLMLTGRQTEANVTLTKNNNPYILGVYEIPAKMTLTIEPGVVIKSSFNAAAIDVSGNLILAGNNDEPIILTSGRDASFNTIELGTTVGNWPSPNPAAKDWQGIWVHPGGNAAINSGIIRYAGHDFRVDNFIYRGFISEALRAENADVVINNSEFSNSGAADVYLYGSTSTIASTVFSGAGNVSFSDLAIESENSVLHLYESSFKNFGNTNGPVWAKFVWPEFVDLHFENNSLDAVFLDRVATKTDRTIDTSIPIILNTAVVDPATTLTIKPGVTIQLPTGGGLEVQGSLEAVGTPENPITFTTAPGASYWNAVAFNHSISHLSYVVFNQGNLLSQGVLQAKDSDVSIERSSMLDNRPPGLQIISLTNSRFTAVNSVVGYTEKPNFAELTGIATNGGSLDLDGVIFKNLSYGIVGRSNPLSALSIKNMDQDYFPGTPVPWDPIVWVGSDGKTIAIDNSSISEN